MEEIIDLIATDSSASDVSDKIKDVLFAKAAGKIDSSKQAGATALFADTEATQEEE